MLSELGLIDKLQKIEALYLGATTVGEKAAAAQMMANVQNKLESYRQEEKTTEWTLTVENQFEKRLLKAILAKHGLSAYRYPRQRYTTLKVMSTKTTINTIIWPQYLERTQRTKSDKRPPSYHISKNKLLHARLPEGHGYRLHLDCPFSLISLIGSTQTKLPRVKKVLGAY